MDKLQLISALAWYLETKNLFIKDACVLRCPLSVSDTQKLRIYYSQYFMNLLAITELLLQDYKGIDGKANERYKVILYEKLDFDKNHSGNQNYDYLRELRNSILHRGLDITAHAKSNDEGYIFIYAPDTVYQRNKNSEYKTFDKYLLDVIIKADNAMMLSVREHLHKEEVFDLSVTTEELKEHIKNRLLINPHIPEYVKDMSENAFSMLTDAQMLEVLSSNNIKVKKLLEEEIIQFIYM